MNVFKVLIISLFLSNLAFSQVLDSAIVELKPRQVFKAAKKAELAGDYYAANEYYKISAEAREEHYKSHSGLARTYYLARDYKNAEKAYREFFQKWPDEGLMEYFYYGFTLQHLEKYAEAADQFKKFKKIYDKGDAKVMKKMARIQMLACDSAYSVLNREQKIHVQNVGPEINKAHMDYSPIPLNDSTFYYVSVRTDTIIYKIKDDSSQVIPKRTIYEAKKKAGKDLAWEFKEAVEAPFNVNGMETNNGTWDTDSSYFYYTLCEPNWKNKMICQLWRVEYFGENDWGTPEKLPEPINLKDYTTTQPAIATESRKGYLAVYFISDRLGGKGGMDLWVSIYDAKKQLWKDAKNCGAKINTVGNEMSPYWDDSTKTMYFSSNGYPGAGGLDIYKTAGEVKSWNKVINLGAPFNSSYDDLYFSMNQDRESGYFASNRPGSVSVKGPSCCDDIYYYQPVKNVSIFVTGEVISMLKIDSLNTDSMVSLTGAELKVFEVKNDTTILVKSITTDEDGKYVLEDLEADKEYKVVAEKDGFLKTSTTVKTDGVTYSESREANIYINKEDERIVLKNIYYEFDKDVLTPESKATIDTTLMQILLDNPLIIIELGSHTDSKGSMAYNQDLSRRRAQSVVDYLISKGIPKERLEAKGYGETTPIAPNKNADGTDNPEGRAKNRRTEFRVIGELEQELIMESGFTGSTIEESE